MRFQRDVSLAGKRLATLRRHLHDDLASSFDIDIGNTHTGPLSAETLRRCPAYARAGAGNQHRFSLKPETCCCHDRIVSTLACLAWRTP
jgi:hypothetical protein